MGSGKLDWIEATGLDYMPPVVSDVVVAAAVVKVEDCSGYFSANVEFVHVNMSDEGYRSCPLCAEEMLLTEQQLKHCDICYEIRKQRYSVKSVPEYPIWKWKTDVYMCATPNNAWEHVMGVDIGGRLVLYSSRVESLLVAIEPERGLKWFIIFLGHQEKKFKSTSLFSVTLHRRDADGGIVQEFENPYVVSLNSLGRNHMMADIVGVNSNDSAPAYQRQKKCIAQ
ncbi:hypothetical protein Tco_0580345 [Tanacetum coccineum]